MRTFLLDKSQFWVIFHVVASGGLIQPQRWWQKSRGYHWKTRENENKTQVWTEFNSPSDNKVLHLCVVLCHGTTQSLTPVILKDLKMNKTARREIHSEADRHGDMQFLSGEINLLNFLWHLHLVSEFLPYSCIHPELNLTSSVEEHLNWRETTARKRWEMHPLSGTGGSAAFEASDLSVLPPFFIWGPLNPILHNSFVFPAPHEPSSQIFVLGLSEFLLSMKEEGHRKRENLFYPGFCCSGHGPSARMQVAQLGLPTNSRKIRFFPPFLLILYWIHLFAWTRKSHWSLLCAIVRGLGFIPDLKPQKNLNIESAQDVTEWRFIYNPIFTISDTQCSRVGFFSSSDQSLTWAEFSKSLAPGLMLVQGKWDDHSGNNLYVGL